MKQIFLGWKMVQNVAEDYPKIRATDAVLLGFFTHSCSPALASTSSSIYFGLAMVSKNRRVGPVSASTLSGPGRGLHWCRFQFSLVLTGSLGLVSGRPAEVLILPPLSRRKFTHFFFAEKNPPLPPTTTHTQTLPTGVSEHSDSH